MSDLVINVEVPLALILAHHPRLLQEEVGDFATIRLSASAELNLEIFPLVETKSEDRMTNTLGVDTSKQSFRRGFIYVYILKNLINCC